MFPIHSSRQTPRGRHRFTSLEQLEDRVTPDAEFQVDTFTDLIQTTPAVASASVTGHSVVTYLHTEGNGTGISDVYARVYDPQGQPVGPEVKVNDSGRAFLPADVAMDADGDFVVVWENVVPVPTGGFDSFVYARRFNAAGVPQGGSFVVPSFNEGQQTRPVVAMDAMGGFTVVWQGPGARIPDGPEVVGIYGRTFTAAGVPVGSQFEVVRSGIDGVPFPGAHTTPDVARGTAGDVVVAWQHAPSDTPGNPDDILARRYSAGGTPLGEPERVNQTTGIDHFRPAVAMIAANDYVVTWETFVVQPGRDESDVYARRISPAGDTGEFRVNTVTQGGQSNSDVALDGAGRFMIVWVDSGPSGGGVGDDGRSAGIFGRRFDANGTPLEGVEFGVNLTTARSQSSPVVAADSCGDFVALWHGNEPGSPDQVGVFGRRFVFPEADDTAHRQDSDGDAIPDCWEIHGYSVLVQNSQTGVEEVAFVNLPAMGADPLRKDVFVEVDWMQSGHSHRPKREALKLVRDSFARAPVLNPDGSMGITLHIDAGRDSLMSPGGDKMWNTPDDLEWGLLSRGTQLPHVDDLGHNIPAGDPDGAYDWTAVDEIKNGPDGLPDGTDDHFSTARAATFHYCLFIHNLGDNGGTSGISRNGDGEAFFEGAADFIVSLGSWTNGIGNVQEQAGTFMHELGHNLGLGHGGDDGRNYKPNYLSVMNYSFQIGGVLFDDPNQPGGVLPGLYDYSRFDLPDLDEDHLNETVGLRGNPPDPVLSPILQSYGTIYYDANGVERIIGFSDQIDWNGDGDFDELDIDVNINDSRSVQGNPSFGVLNGYDDWANPVFNGGGIGQLGVNLPRVMSTPVDSLTVEEASQIPKLQGVAVAAPDGQPLVPGANLTLTFTVKNLGTTAATFNLAAAANQPWADLTGVPASVVLEPGASQDVTIPVAVPAMLDGTTEFEVSLAAVHQANGLVSDTGLVLLTVAAPAPDDGEEPAPDQPAPPDGGPTNPVPDSRIIVDVIAVGGGAGGPPVARLLNADGSERLTITPFGPGFAGGVRVTTGDVNGDGTADVIAAAGPGGGPHVRVFDGLSGAELFSFFAYDPGFTGGVFVASDDFNGDGRADLVVSPDLGGGPHVRILSGADLAPIADFFALDDPNFRGGVRIAVGDLNADGRPDLVAAAGLGGGPRVVGFDGTALATGGREALFPDLFVFDPSLRGGSFAAVGDVDGDGFADLVVAPGAGGGPRVLALSGRDLTGAATVTPVADFFVGDGSGRSGVRVSVADLDGDGTDEIVTGSAEGTTISVFAGSSASGERPLDTFDLASPGGVFVG